MNSFSYPLLITATTLDLCYIQKVLFLESVRLQTTQLRRMVSTFYHDANWDPTIMPLQLEPYTLYQRIPHTPIIPKHLFGMKCQMVNQNYSTIIEKVMPPAKSDQNDVRI